MGREVRETYRLRRPFTIIHRMYALSYAQARILDAVDENDV